nr:hypothetical protein [Propionicimonas sp.]
MTSTSLAAPAAAVSSVPVRAPGRLWFWTTAAAVAAAQAAKYPVLHAYVAANIDQGPDLADLPADMLATALAAGSAMGLALSLVVSLVALAVLRRLGSRSRPERLRRHVFPFWLSGVATVGLVVPDLLTAVTGVLHPWTTPAFLLVYPAAAVAAVFLAPGPRRARFRLADAALVAVLPFV